MLDNESHEILTEFKRIHKSRNLDDALIELLKDYARKGQLFRK
jgi:hypothetical protein